MNIGSAPTICGSSIKGPSVVGVSATGFGLRPPPFTDTPTTDSHLDCRYARILSVAAHFRGVDVSAPLSRERLAGRRLGFSGDSLAYWFPVPTLTAPATVRTVRPYR